MPCTDYQPLQPLEAVAHAVLQIYRNFEIGKLVKLIMLDTRVIGESMGQK